MTAVTRWDAHTHESAAPNTLIVMFSYCGWRKVTQARGKLVNSSQNHWVLFMCSMEWFWLGCFSPEQLRMAGISVMLQRDHSSSLPLTRCWLLPSSVTAGESVCLSPVPFSTCWYTICCPIFRLWASLLKLPKSPFLFLLSTSSSIFFLPHIP